jgi:hypothetical protein
MFVVSFLELSGFCFRASYPDSDQHFGLLILLLWFGIASQHASVLVLSPRIHSSASWPRLGEIHSMSSVASSDGFGGPCVGESLFTPGGVAVVRVKTCKSCKGRGLLSTSGALYSLYYDGIV